MAGFYHRLLKIHNNAFLFTQTVQTGRDGVGWVLCDEIL